MIMGFQHSPLDFHEQQQVQSHYRQHNQRCLAPHLRKKVIDLRVYPVTLVIVHVPALVQLQNLTDLSEVGVDPEHELIKDRSGSNLYVYSQTVDELMVDECVVGMGVITAIEFDEVGRDVVGLGEGGEVLLVEAADDAEGEPVVHAEDAVNGVLRGDVPHAVVLHRVTSVDCESLFNLVLLLLQDCLKHVVACYVVGVLLSTEEDVLTLRLLIQLLPRCLQRVLQPVQHISQELGLRLGDERPDLHSREKIDLLLQGVIIHDRSVSAHDGTQREGDDFRLRSDAILHPLLTCDIVEPGEIAKEEGVGVDPHASVFVDEEETHEVSPVLLADLVVGVEVDAVKARLAVVAEEARVVVVGEEAELPTADAAEVRHVVDAHPREQLRRVEARVPEGPQDLGDLVELVRRLQPHHQQSHYYPHYPHQLQHTPSAIYHQTKQHQASLVLNLKLRTSSTSSAGMISIRFSSFISPLLPQRTSVSVTSLAQSSSCRLKGQVSLQILRRSFASIFRFLSQSQSRKRNLSLASRVVLTWKTERRQRKSSKLMRLALILRISSSKSSLMRGCRG